MKKYLFLFALAALFQVRAEAVDAAKAKAYFNQLGYNEALKIIYGPNNYQVETLFTLDKNELSLSQLKAEKAKLAVKFFHLGEVIDSTDKNKLFAGTPESEVYQWLQSRDLIVELDCPELYTEKTCYQTTHSLYSVTLKNNKILYAFADFPANYRKNTSPSAQLSTTSMLTLWKLENSSAPGTLSGVAADFGSGVGILGHALLMLHPNVTMVYGLEIDEHSKRLSILNAHLNGLHERYKVLDNKNTTLLTTTLGNRKLSFAVSNPPFNIVPPSLSEAFTNYGDGGCNGLNVTKIFIEQFLKNAAPNAKMVFYSQLGFNKEGDALFKDLEILKNSNISLKSQHTHLYGLEFTDLNLYVSALMMFVKTHSPNADIPRRSELLDELNDCGVNVISPYFVDIINGVPANPQTPLVKNGVLITSVLPAPFKHNYGNRVLPELKGGVIITSHPTNTGGVRRQIQGGESITINPYLIELKKKLKNRKKEGQ